MVTIYISVLFGAVYRSCASWQENSGVTQIIQKGYILVPGCQDRPGACLFQCLTLPRLQGKKRSSPCEILGAPLTVSTFCSFNILILTQYNLGLQDKLFLFKKHTLSPYEYSGSEGRILELEIPSEVVSSHSGSKPQRLSYLQWTRQSGDGGELWSHLPSGVVQTARTQTKL